MNAKRHVTMLLQATVVWFAFWVIGLPDYYQQYSQVGIAIGSIILSVLISLSAVWFLRYGRDENRMQRALWVSFYYSVPLAIYDYLYCGLYLGHGADYLTKYWYLSVFYLTVWLTFPPTAWLLNGKLKTSTPKR
jgi:hypothetical protein